MKKAVVLATLFIFYYIFSTHSASALSISPGRIEMDFVPGYENDFSGSVTSNGEEDIEMYVDGELKDYITLLTPDRIAIHPDQPFVYRFSIKLPEKFDVPGRHVGYIWAMQHVEPQAGVTIARVKVGATIRVNVPYPGKYAEIAFNIKNPKVNDTIIFEVPVTNLGKENITKAKAEIEILDLNNQTVVILQTEDKPIETTKTETLVATWFSNVDPGLYKAKVKVSYDGETASLERDFNIGAPLIKIINVTAEPIVNGTIGKILTQVRSYWNEEIKNVYVEIFINKGRQGVVAYHKSESFTVGAFSTPTVTNFWDTTEGAEPGNYSGIAVVNYLEINDTKEFNIEVVTKPGFVIGNEIMIIIAVAVTAIVVLAAVALHRRKREKFKQKKLM